MGSASIILAVPGNQNDCGKTNVANNIGTFPEDPLSNLRSRLPQELVDHIRDDFLDAALLPGHFLLLIRDQESYSWHGKQPRRIARSELLTLNKRTYEEYRHRMWTDNTCVFILKGEKPTYYELVPVKGRLSDPDDYLASYIENEEDLSWAGPGIGLNYEDAAEDQIYDLDLQLHERSLRGISVYLVQSCLWSPSMGVFGKRVTLVNTYGLDGFNEVLAPPKRDLHYTLDGSPKDVEANE